MSLILTQVTKSFEDHLVVQGIDLAVSDGELFVLLGASGSGKSTLLRLIAGLIRPDGGRIDLHGQEITNLAPQLRNTGFVFQSYALFRHLTVSENVEFGLKIRKVSAAERRRRGDELLELVGLSGLGSRLPRELSGGQRQRVALARALAYEPKLLLLDEPFGALDLRIRSQLRRSLREIQKQLRITTLLVTHDQEEAFELADRIGVLERGKLVEVGKPEKLYHNPDSEFVATFIGGGNVLVGRAEKKMIRLGETLLPFPKNAPEHEDGAPVRILFRPEAVQFQSEKFPIAAGILPIGQGRVIERTFTGPTERVRFELTSLQGTRPLSPALSYGQRYAVVNAVCPSSPGPSKTEDPEQKHWIGLSNFHVLSPTGLKFLVCLDQPNAGKSSLAVVTELIRASHGYCSMLDVFAETSERETKQKSLQQIRDQIAQDIRSHFDIKLRHGSLSHELSLEVQQGFYDVTVLDHPKGQEDRIRRLSKISRRILLYTQCPVMFAYPGKAEFKKILVCTAGGEPGKSDIRLGARLARHLKSTVTVFHAGRHSYSSAERGRVQRYLSRAQEMFAAHGVQADANSIDGPAEEVIVETAQRDGYDLVVIGAPLIGARPDRNRDDFLSRLVDNLEASLLVVPMAE